MTSGWLPCSKRERDAGVGRMRKRALAFDHVPMMSAASGESISAAPAAKSATTASIGIPLAGDQDSGLSGGAKIDVDPAPNERASQARARCIFSESAIGADGEQTFAAALRPVAIGMPRGRMPNIDQVAGRILRAAVLKSLHSLGECACRR